MTAFSKLWRIGQPFIIMLAVVILTSRLSQINAQDAFPADRIMTLAYSPTSERVAVGYGTGLIKIFNAVSGQVELTLIGHTTTISSLAWNSTGNQLVSGSLNPDPSARVWDTNTGQLIRTFISVGDNLEVVGWTLNNQQIITLSFDGTNSIYDIASGNLMSSIDTGSTYVLKWSPDNSKIAFPLLYGGIDIRSAATFQNIIYLGANSGKISGDITNQVVSLAWKPDNSAVAVGTWGGNVLIWNITTGQLTFEQRGNDYQGSNRYLSFIKGLRFNTDGSEITSISGNGTGRTWSTNTGQLINNFTLPSPIYAVDWSPSGDRIAYGNTGSSIQIVNAPNLLAPTPTRTPTPYPCPCSLWTTSTSRLNSSLYFL